MLENERYGEAMDLLRFLLQCQGQDQRHYDEWRALLEWLEAAFPQSARGTKDREDDGEAEEEPSEEDMKRQNVRAKLAEDRFYAEKLLRTAQQEPFGEQNLLALEQLSYLEGADIDNALVEWLQSRPLHPLLQFRVLQTLRKRGMLGSIELIRGQERAQIDVESVPLGPEEFPPQIALITERVAQQTEVQEPTLYYFAQELWTQFIMAIYGTDDYDSIVNEQDDETIDIWAASLHQIVAETLTGSRSDEEIRHMYGVTDTMRFRFEQAYRTMKQFVAAGTNA
ncbi:MULTISPECIES: hypothetical protein [Paenibacillus]|uniref:Uncharacterized protein n=1 Tax=Paenibacillus albilobatus TaxID=2716884 RepID=A0A919XKN5_9BACL|nr:MULTISPECIES: hypothetical protein [Paenibacillus]GIO34716.1 hypothetical protein J2TS6_58570 [Paenibacillus albilobatus]